MPEVDRFDDALRSGEHHAVIEIAEAALAEIPSLEGALAAFAAYAFAGDPEGALALLERCAGLPGEAAALRDVLRGCARCEITRRARETDGELALRRVVLGNAPPAMYPESSRHASDAVRTGQLTVWEHERGYAVARGQRDFRCTDRSRRRLVGMRSISRIELHTPGRPQPRTARAGP